MRVETKMAIALLMVWPALAGADPICQIAPLTARPSGSDGVGNSAGAPGGCFAKRGDPDRLVLGIGTTVTPGVKDLAGMTIVDAVATATPEPASLLLIGTGLIVLAGTIRRGGKLRRVRKRRADRP